MADASEPTDHRFSPSFLIAAIVGLVALTIGLRVYHAEGQSVTFDEYYEIQLAKQNVGNIIRRGDGFPPLYAVTLHIWDKAFDSANGRYFSILLAALGCVAIYRLASAFAGQSVGLWSALLLAVLPIHMFYSTEIRAYSMLMLLGTLALEAFLYAIRHDRWKHWCLYSVLTALGLHTHYLFGVFPAITLVISLFYVRSPKPFVAGAVILGLTIPFTFMWLSADLGMQSNYIHRRPFGVGELAFTYGSYLLGYTLGPSLPALHELTANEAVAAVMPWAIAFCASLTAMLWCTVRDATWKETELPVFATLAAAPLVTGIATQYLGIGYHIRYSIWAVVPILVLLGVLTSQAWRSRLGKVAVAALFSLFAIALINRHHVDYYRNEDLRSASKYLATEDPAGDPVLVVSGYMVEPLKHYIEASRSLYAIPMTSLYADRLTEMRRLLESVATETDDFWLLYTREFHEDKDGKLFAAIQGYATVELVTRFAGIKLYRCSALSKPTTPPEFTSAHTRPSETRRHNLGSVSNLGSESR